MIEFLLRNIGLKLVALVLAASTWLATHALTSREEVLSDIRIEVKIPEGFAIRNTSVNGLEVTFRGSKEDIIKLDRQSVWVEIDLEDNAREGEQSIWLGARDVVFPGAARVEAIEPRELFITLDEEIRKKVIVKPNIIGAPDKGIEVEGEPVSEPQHVLLIGSRSRLENVTLVQTEPMDITGRIQSDSRRLSLLPPSEDWGGRIEPNKVLVTVKLTEQVSSRDLEELEVHVLLRNERKPLIQLKPATVKVRLQGKADTINALEPGALFVYINCSSVEEGTNYELPVRVDAPAGVEVVEINPPLIKVEVGQ